MNTTQIIVVIAVLAVVIWFMMRQRGSAGAEEVKSYLQRGAKVIDVRSPGEYGSGHLPDAVNIPVGELESRIGQYATNKEQPLLLHCASGMRSGSGKRILEQMGYTQVLNLGSYGQAEKLLKEARQVQVSP